jgi:hypothetical protein
MMTPELAKRFALIFPTAVGQRTGVACVAGVADATRYASKPAELRQLRPLRHESGNAGETTNEGVAAHVAPQLAPDADAIEERAALAADCVPTCYLGVWARLNHQKPAHVSEAAWRLALDDGGRFLDVWGEQAAALGWSVDALFDPPRDHTTGGLIWRLDGTDVIELRARAARTNDQRIIANET